MSRVVTTSPKVLEAGGEPAPGYAPQPRPGPTRSSQRSTGPCSSPVASSTAMPFSSTEGSPAYGPSCGGAQPLSPALASSANSSQVDGFPSAMSGSASQSWPESRSCTGRDCTPGTECHHAVTSRADNPGPRRTEPAGDGTLSTFAGLAWTGRGCFRSRRPQVRILPRAHFEAPSVRSGPRSFEIRLFTHGSTGFGASPR